MTTPDKVYIMLKEHLFRRKLVIMWGSKTMNTYKNKLQEYLDRNPIGYTDGNSLLEQLYWCYIEANTFDNSEIREQFEKIYSDMPELPMEKFDAIFDKISTLTILQEKYAFQVGAKIGMRLAAELLC